MSKSNRKSTTSKTAPVTDVSNLPTNIEPPMTTTVDSKGAALDPAEAKKADDIAKLLAALRSDDVTAKEKKTIRRVLRDTYNYYLSKDRTSGTNALVSRILGDTPTATPAEATKETPVSERNAT